MKTPAELRVAFYDTKPYDRESFERQNQAFGFHLKYFPSHLTEETVALCRGYDAVCVFVNDQVTKGIVDSLAEMKVPLLALRSAGYNNVDLNAAAGKIKISRVPSYSPHGVAEHAVAMMLTLNRNTHRAFYRTRDSNFSINGLEGFDMVEKTAGIVGTGQIGRIVCEILLGFGMRVIAYDPFPAVAWAQARGVELVDLETLYARSDIISLHCPLTPQNIHMINRNSLARMKKGVMLINTGRGQLIRTEDLLEALRNQQVGRAGLDVYEEETDYFFEDFSSSVVKDDVLARLLTFPNVLVTSHQAFFTVEALAKIATTTLENIRSYFYDGKVLNEVCAKPQKDGTCQE
jgi:D-lactate dehydrogenase